MPDTFVPRWIEGDGAETDIVISSRARLARSLRGFSFPFKASDSELKQIAERVLSAAKEIGGFTQLTIDKLPVKTRYSLVDAYIISPEFVQGGVGRIVLLDSNEKLSIMVNEEDHLRIQIMDSGLNVGYSWDNINSLDNKLAQYLDYGFSEKIGFLTTSPTNLGTGLRLSVMMHLVALVQNGELASHIQAAGKLGVSVRGVHGEGSRPLGDLFQVSNEFTLGMPEDELVHKVDSVAHYLLEAERRARKEFIEERSNILSVMVDEALAKLKHSHSVSAEKALSLLSIARMGHETGMVVGCHRKSFNLLLTQMKSMFDRDFETGTMRAKLLRKYFKNVTMVF